MNIGNILDGLYISVCFAGLVFIVIGLALAVYSEVKARKLRHEIEDALKSKEESK